MLKDGASAIYGSDAIGGVINFVTRREFAGVDVFGSYTKTEDGGADSGRADPRPAARVAWRATASMRSGCSTCARPSA